MNKELNTLESFKEGFKIERNGKIITLTEEEMSDFRYLDKALSGQNCLDCYDYYDDTENTKYMMEYLRNDEEICFYIEEDIEDICFSNCGEIEQDVIKKKIDDCLLDTYKIKNIEWDTDGSEEVLASLPKSVNVPSIISDENIANYLSDKYGYCVFSFQEQE